ncbi:hypothetical protein DTO169C6_3963 [Paecilomyces variotii]|nr:hypothetical protein DTO169C6_3963 [Paecilomyces variotii]
MEPDDKTTPGHPLDSVVETTPVVIIDFDESIRHPHNWPNVQRWSILILNTLISLLVNLSTTIVAPLLETISAEFHMDPQVEGPLVMSSYVLTLALGPLLLAPFGELYGRVVLIQCGLLVYLVFNLACGFATTKAQLIAFRVLAGIGSGAAPVVGIAMISDCFRNDERGTALGVLNMAFILAAPLGAIVGGLAAQSTSWRFIFFAPSIAAGLLVFVGLFVYHESYPPVILSRKKRQFQHDGHLVCKTPYDDRHPTIADLYYKTIIRPVYFLTTQPIIQVLSLYTGYIYGLTYLIFSTFTSLWEQQYHETASIASLHYIAAGIGYFIGIVACILFADRIYRGLKGKNNDIGRPEFRIPMMSVSAILIPTSLFWYGWTAQEHIQWVVPNLAIVLTMCGCTIVFQCTTAYCIEAYPLYAASASAASFLCRGLCAFGFPLFAPSLYARLGYGWGDSILGFVALIISGLVPVMLWKFGVRLRKISSYAV